MTRPLTRSTMRYCGIPAAKYAASFGPASRESDAVRHFDHAPHVSRHRRMLQVVVNAARNDGGVWFRFVEWRKRDRLLRLKEAAKRFEVGRQSCQTQHGDPMPTADGLRVVSCLRAILADDEAVDEFERGVFGQQPALEGTVIPLHGPRDDSRPTLCGLLENGAHLFADYSRPPDALDLPRHVPWSYLDIGGRLMHTLAAGCLALLLVAAASAIRALWRRGAPVTNSWGPPSGGPACDTISPVSGPPARS
jgi:hypothetical protein